MNLIGFSHYYRKLHGQLFGSLIDVKRITVSDETVPFLTRAYDTEYIGNDGCSRYTEFKYGVGDMCLRLTFMGEMGIPFTTYRDIPDPKTYVPFGIEPVEFRFTLPYVERLGQEFAFKFKGDELPKELAEKVASNEHCLKIFD